MKRSSINQYNVKPGKYLQWWEEDRGENKIRRIISNICTVNAAAPASIWSRIWCSKKRILASGWRHLYLDFIFNSGFGPSAEKFLIAFPPSLSSVSVMHVVQRRAAVAKLLPLRTSEMSWSHNYTTLWSLAPLNSNQQLSARPPLWRRAYEQRQDVNHRWSQTMTIK